MPPFPLKSGAVGLAALLVLGGAPADARSLDQDHHWLSGGAVLSVVRGRDDLLVPLVWQGPGTGLSVHYERKDGGFRHQAGGQLGVAALWNRFGHMGAALNAETRYRQLYEVARLGPTGTLAVGGRLSWQTEPLYLAQWDDSYLYWQTAIALAPSVQYVWLLTPSNELGLTLDWPLLGAASRPPGERTQKIDPLTHPLDLLPRLHQDLRWVGPADWVAPTLTVAWRQQNPAGPSWRLALELGRSYSPHPAPSWHERVGLLSEVSFGL